MRPCCLLASLRADLLALRCHSCSVAVEKPPLPSLRSSRVHLCPHCVTARGCFSTKSIWRRTRHWSALLACLRYACLARGCARFSLLLCLNLRCSPSQGPQGSVTLTERGDVAQIPRHPRFRLFGAMNPATDTGKRDLPAGIKARCVHRRRFLHATCADIAWLNAASPSFMSVRPPAVRICAPSCQPRSLAFHALPWTTWWTFISPPCVKLTRRCWTALARSRNTGAQQLSTLARQGGFCDDTYRGSVVLYTGAMCSSPNA